MAKTNKTFDKLNQKNKKRTPKDILGYAIFADFVAVCCFGVDRYIESQYPGSGDLPFYAGILIVVSIITGYAMYVHNTYYK